MMHTTDSPSWISAAALRPTAGLLPLNRSGVRVGVRWYATPSDPEVLLQAKYGPTWRIPDPEKSGSWG